MAPLFVVAYRLVPAHRRTEAGTWVNTGDDVGTSVGAAGVGVVIDVAGARTGLVAAAVLLGLTSVLVGAGRGG